MHSRVISLLVLGFWLAATESLSAGMQRNKTMQARSGPAQNPGPIQRTEPARPSSLIGIQARQIQVGIETKFLPDLLLQDQNGRRVRFYSDLIKDKIVLISFFFTSCTSTCPTQAEVFSNLQVALGDRLGKKVFLISVTIDPETDTARRLSTWGAQHNVRKGWTLVTGAKDDMRKLVGHLTGNPLGRIDLHSPFIYIGNDQNSRGNTDAFWRVEPIDKPGNDRIFLARQLNGVNPAVTVFVGALSSDI